MIHLSLFHTKPFNNVLSSLSSHNLSYQLIIFHTLNIFGTTSGSKWIISQQFNRTSGTTDLLYNLLEPLGAFLGSKSKSSPDIVFSMILNLLYNTTLTCKPWFVINAFYGIFQFQIHSLNIHYNPI